MGCPIQSSNVSGVLANGSVIITITSIGVITVPFSDLPSGNAEKKRAALEQILQNYFDVRIPLSQLPSDDPDKFINPRRPELFWSDVDGIPQTPDSANTHYTSRNCKVTITVVGTGANTSVSTSFSTPS
jgi:hypothetical protein